VPPTAGTQNCGHRKNWGGAVGNSETENRPNTNVKQRFFNKKVSYRKQYVYSGSQIFAPPLLGLLRVSGSMVDPVKSYRSLVVTLQNLVAHMSHIGLPCCRVLGSQTN